MGNILLNQSHTDVMAAAQWAEDVAHRRIDHGTLPALAAERFLFDLENCASGSSRWAFDAELAQRAMDFCQMLPNIKGPLAGKAIQLLDWQKFALVNIFGFVDAETGYRRFMQSGQWVPRGNGKTSYAAPLAIYMNFMLGEGGAEGIAGAVTKEQAGILFDTMKEMIRRTPQLMNRFNMKLFKDAIVQTSTASSFIPVSSDAKALDGKNLQVGILDEIAQHKSAALYDVMQTALSKRNEPHLATISTASGNVTGIGRSLWSYGEKILRGVLEDDRYFALIFCAEPEDDPYEEATWAKCNPSYGVTVMPEGIRAIARQAKASPAAESNFRTKHLNQWQSTEVALFSPIAWAQCAEPNLLDQLQGSCAMALDFSTKNDLTSWCAAFPWVDDAGRHRYDIVAKHFVSQHILDVPRNLHYKDWAAKGALTICPGAEIDFEMVEDSILEFAGKFDVTSCGFDPWNAVQTAQKLSNAGMNMVEFKASTRNFSQPTLELGVAMDSRRIRHNGDPVLAWALSNVVGHLDARGNVYPRKEERDAKIDPAIALIMAIGRVQAEMFQEPSFEGLGIFGWAAAAMVSASLVLPSVGSMIGSTI